MTKITLLKFFNQIILEICGVGITLALLQDSKSVEPILFFFLKCQMIVHEIITINKIFNVRFFIYNYSKNLNHFMGE